MAAIKSFRTYEQAAFLALAELYQGRFIPIECLQIREMQVGEPLGASTGFLGWYNRYITFVTKAGKIVVLVRTDSQDLRDPSPIGHLVWRPDQADLVVRGKDLGHLCRNLTPVPHWSK